jgi:hypothetical protein
MPYWLGLFVLRRTCRQNRLYITLFHTVITLSEHHHHYHIRIFINMYVYVYTYVYTQKQIKMYI